MNTSGCSQHTHLIAFDAIETFLCAAQSAEDIATANNDANLHARLSDMLDLLGIVGQALLVDAVAFLAHETLTRELE